MWFPVITYVWNAFEVEEVLNSYLKLREGIFLPIPIMVIKYDICSSYMQPLLMYCIPFLISIYMHVASRISFPLPKHLYQPHYRISANYFFLYIYIHIYIHIYMFSFCEYFDVSLTDDRFLYTFSEHDLMFKGLVGECFNWMVRYLNKRPKKCFSLSEAPPTVTLVLEKWCKRT